MGSVEGFSPIVLFVFRRIDTTRQTVESILQNPEAKESLLYVFSDGPKTPEDIPKIAAVRDYVKSIRGFKDVRLIIAESNKGLQNSIIDGVSQVVREHGRVIVLEDDLVVSRYFLEYLNRGLDLYKDDDRVISISSYMYPVKEKLPDYFFLRLAENLGWATWKRGWDLFERDGEKLLKELQDTRQEKIFDFDGKYPYTDMLRMQSQGQVSSWAIRWYASAFLKHKMTLCPAKPLVKHIGYGQDAEHTQSAEDMEAVGVEDPTEIRYDLQLIPVAGCNEARDAIKRYFSRVCGDFFDKAFRKIKKILGSTYRKS